MSIDSIIKILTEAKEHGVDGRCVPTIKYQTEEESESYFIDSIDYIGDNVIINLI